MPKNFPKNTVERIIDANINRAKEGLRVCEEITRFILNSRGLTQKLKTSRHKINPAAQNSGFILRQMLCSRNSAKDIGKHIYVKELERGSIEDIFFANMQRVKESIRVLEEFSKLSNKKGALKFKEIRYSIYEIEKEIAKKLPALSNS